MRSDTTGTEKATVAMALLPRTGAVGATGAFEKHRSPGRSGGNRALGHDTPLPRAFWRTFRQFAFDVAQGAAAAVHANAASVHQEPSTMRPPVFCSKRELVSARRRAAPERQILIDRRSTFPACTSGRVSKAVTKAGTAKSNA